jgi:hypothetical protein
MTDPRDPNRNPFVIPDTKPVSRQNGCPECGSKHYDGQKIYGVITFTCLDCKNKWQGGVGQEPQDPRMPFPPQDPRTVPNVEFARTKDSGERPVDILQRRPDPTPDYRKGAPIPNPGDANDV